MDILVILAMLIVMMQIIIVDVDGMGEIVVVMIITIITVRLVNALILLLITQENTSTMNQFLITEERKILQKIVSSNTQGIQEKKTGCQD